MNKSNLIVRMYNEGVSQQIIAWRLNMSKSDVFRCIHGLKPNVVLRRCPICGCLHKGKICLSCEISAMPLARKKARPKKKAAGPIIELELKPREYRRYLFVKKKKIESLSF